VYHLVELGNAPNGIDPADCGDYRDVLESLYTTYHESLDSARILARPAASTATP
jgi:hypothetical protein